MTTTAYRIDREDGGSIELLQLPDGQLVYRACVGERCRWCEDRWQAELHLQRMVTQPPSPMTLHQRVEQFLDTANPGDKIALSKGACIELGTGLILGLGGNGFYLLDSSSRAEMGPVVTADDVITDALCWAHDTGAELIYG